MTLQERKEHLLAQRTKAEQVLANASVAIQQITGALALLEDLQRENSELPVADPSDFDGAGKRAA